MPFSIHVLRAEEWGPMLFSCCVDTVLPICILFGFHSSLVPVGYHGKFSGQIINLKFSLGPVNTNDDTTHNFNFVVFPFLTSLADDLSVPVEQRWLACTAEGVHVWD